MFVCVCACVHAYALVRACMRMCLCVRACVHVLVRVWVHVCMRVCVHVHIFAWKLSQLPRCRRLPALIFTKNFSPVSGIAIKAGISYLGKD